MSAVICEMQAAEPAGLKPPELKLPLKAWKSAQADCVWPLSSGVGFQPTFMR